MYDTAFLPADILIPADAEMEKWSVIACDQFTSERDYWDRVTEYTNGAISTRHMILPEAYLTDSSPIDAAEETGRIMESYLSGGVFEMLPSSLVYVERKVTAGLRCGIVGAIDLERYDYRPFTKLPIRASEKTVAERLPARMLIRENAVMELPHVMMLIDDSERSVIEPLTNRKSSMRKLYDFDLCEGGGHISGWQLTAEDTDRVMDAIERRGDRSLQFVIGDGNHSLAAAKELWEKTKLTITPEEAKNHPARFALVELNNIYDDAVSFEPIHRVVFNVSPDLLLDVAREKLSAPDGRPVCCVVGGKKVETIPVRGKTFGSMVDTIQEFLEEYAAVYEGTLDYIHDEDSLIRLTEEQDTVGFIMPCMEKSELFSTVEQDGVFPKKSFSIGHARDKRYYLECRKIK